MLDSNKPVGRDRPWLNHRLLCGFCYVVKKKKALIEIGGFSFYVHKIFNNIYNIMFKFNTYRFCDQFSQKKERKICF